MPFRVEEIDNYYHFKARFEELSVSKFVLVFEDVDDLVMHSEIDSAIAIHIQYEGVLLRIKVPKDEFESKSGNKYTKYLNIETHQLPYGCVYSQGKVVARYYGKKARQDFANLLKFCAETPGQAPVVKAGQGQVIKASKSTAGKSKNDSKTAPVDPRMQKKLAHEEKKIQKEYQKFEKTENKSLRSNQPQKKEKEKEKPNKVPQSKSKIPPQKSGTQPKSASNSPTKIHATPSKSAKSPAPSKPPASSKPPAPKSPAAQKSPPAPKSPPAQKTASPPAPKK